MTAGDWPVSSTTLDALLNDAPDFLADKNMQFQLLDLTFWCYEIEVLPNMLTPRPPAIREEYTEYTVVGHLPHFRILCRSRSLGMAVLNAALATRGFVTMPDAYTVLSQSPA